MSIRKYKATSPPAIRQMTTSTFKDVTKKRNQRNHWLLI